MNLAKLLIACCVVMVVSCAEDHSTVEAHAQLAVQFRSAINVNDVNTLVNLIQLPFTVNEQRWETVNDGYGFVLGERKITRIDEKQALVTFLKMFVPGVGIEGQQAKLISATEYDNFKTELAESLNDWRSLKTYLFLRGRADVEHIVLLGIQARSHKVKAIYLN